MSKKIEVAIVGDASKFKRELNDAESATGKFSTGLGKMKVAALAAGVGGVAVMTKFLKGSIGAAMDAQRVQAQTESQLKALGISYKAHASQINEVINKTSQLAAIDDEELQGAFNDLVRVTGNVNTALRDTALAADVARGKHIELDAAAKLVAKAQLGMVGSLKRMGIEIPPVTRAVDALKASKDSYSASELAAAKAADLTATKQEAIAALQTKFAGAAEAYGKTAQGAMDRFHVAVENLQEAIGAKLLPAITFLLNKGTELATYLTTNLGPSISRVINALSQFKGEAEFVAKVLGITLKGALLVVKLSLDLLIIDFRIAAAVIQGLKAAGEAAAGFFTGVFHGAISGARAVVNALDTAVDGVRAGLQGVRSAAVALAGYVTGGLTAALNGVRGVLNSIAGVARSLASAFWSVVHAVESLIGALGRIHVPSIHLPSIPHIGLPKLPHIPGTATGGIVTGPQVRLVGEAGPEAIIPLNKGGALGGDTFHFHFPQYVGSKQELAELIQGELLRVNKRNTTLGFT